MAPVGQPGQIIILNGPPRSGKSSISAAIQNTFEGVWMNLGVDRFKQMTPDRYQPGIGLRPGGERPDLEPLVVVLYRAMYEAIGAHSRLGLNVVVDVGHHDAYSVPRGILSDCARQLSGLPVLFVGVHCPIDVVMERRRATWGAASGDDGSVPKPVSLWQQAVHLPGIYDLEVDTSILSPEACAEVDPDIHFSNLAKWCARKVVLNSKKAASAEDLALAAIRDFITEHGERPTADSWTAAGMKPCERTIRNRFGSFKAAIESALALA